MLVLISIAVAFHSPARASDFARSRRSWSSESTAMLFSLSRMDSSLGWGKCHSQQSSASSSSLLQLDHSGCSSAAGAERCASAAAESQSDGGAEAVGSRLQAVVRQAEVDKGRASYTWFGL